MTKSRSRKRCIPSLQQAAVLLTVVLLPPVAARASITVLLEQPYGKLGLFSPSGHTSIYLDHVCAASPTRLRRCRPGELGIVLSRYDGIPPYDWLATPLMPYLYAVENADEIPMTMDKVTEPKLRDAYRRKRLEGIVPDRPDGSAPPGNWYELVGASYDRTIYGFRVATTAEQDEMLIAVYNDNRNLERYNGIYRNCADFVRDAINRVYPHAIRRNWIADLGLTSPKSAARGIAHYAKKHPEADLDVFVIPQVKGDLPRSHANTTLLEGLVKRYSIPLVLLSPEAEGVALVGYIAHGRFAMPKDAPELDLRDSGADFAIERPFPMALPVLPEAPQPLVARGGNVVAPAAVVAKPVALAQ